MRSTAMYSMHTGAAGAQVLKSLQLLGPLTHLGPPNEQLIPLPCLAHIQHRSSVVVALDAGPVAAVLHSAQWSCPAAAVSTLLAWLRQQAS